MCYSSLSEAVNIEEGGGERQAGDALKIRKEGKFSPTQLCAVFSISKKQKLTFFQEQRGIFDADIFAWSRKTRHIPRTEYL